MTDPVEQAFCDTNTALGAAVVSGGGGLVLLTRTGSRAYGTDHPDSDHDFRGVFVCGKMRLYGLNADWKTVELREPHDAVAYELRHFCQLAAKANPTALEVLWGDDFDCGYVGEYLRENRDLFLSKRIVHTYGGYAISQLRKAQAGTGGSRGADHHKRMKFKLHTLRLLGAGLHALRHGEVLVRVPDPEGLREMAEADIEVVAGVAEDILADMAVEAERSKLPSEPNVEQINNLIYNIREDLI